MRFRTRSGIYIKRNTQFFERILDNLVITIDNILRGHTLFLSLDRDRYPVFIRSPDKSHILTLFPQISHVNIGRHVYPRQVSDMHGSIRIGQSRGNQISLELTHISSL